MHRYAVVTPDLERASLARIAAQMIARDLELSPVPEVFFFQEDRRGLIYNERNLAGYCAVGGQHVGIRMGMTAPETWGTLLHELRHAYQERRGWSARSEIVLERDARIYASSWPFFPRRISFRQLTETLCNATSEHLRGKMSDGRLMPIREVA
jgi:hypothetical protein